jgi:hypothetical protein
VPGAILRDAAKGPLLRMRGSEYLSSQINAPA